MQELPKPTTSFVGGETAVAAVLGLLKTTRLLTITGAGGSGKTRLALAAAGRAATTFADGVLWVDLDPLSEPDLVAPAVAAALGLDEKAGASLDDLLAERLATSDLLLVLDNCEHLAAACAGLANQLLAHCQRLVVLATSRQPLGAAAESTWQAPLLELPPDDAALAQIEAADAVRLFCARSRLVAPAFTLHEQNAQAVAHLCRLLDGLPLAIELAAARSNVLSPQQIAERLDDSLRLLARQGPLSDARHHTLRAALEWSYQMLPTAERALLLRLAVFRGSFGLEAVEAVCSDAQIPPGDVLDLIAGLVEKSLLAVLEHGDTLRYRLLAPLRHFAAGQLAADPRPAGAREWWQARHAAWGLALAERAEDELVGPDQAGWLLRLADEHDELRAGLEWYAATAGQGEAGLRLAAALGRFWCMRGHFAEGKRWLETFLRAGAAEDESPRRVDAANTLARIAFLQSNFVAAVTLCAQALAAARRLEYDEGVETAQIGLGTALWELGDYPAARTELEEMVRYTRPLGHRAALARALNTLGLVTLHQGDSRAANRYFSESLALNRELGNQLGAATALYNLAMQAGHAADYPRAGLLYQEALALQTALGNRSVIADIRVAQGALAAAQGDFSTARAHYEAAAQTYILLDTPADAAYVSAGLGEIAFYTGQYAEAQRCYTGALATFRQAGNRRLVGRCLGWLGRIACRQGDVAAASTLCAEALSLRRAIGHTAGMIFSLDQGGAELALAAGQPAAAARLLGAVERARTEHARPREPVETQQAQQTISRAQDLLGATEFTFCWSEGQEMALDAAAAYALDTLSPATLAHIRSGSGSTLRLFVLGRGRIYRGDRLLTSADWTYSKARELVFYLLCFPGSTREQVGLAFWPDAGPEQVRKRFSAALAHARSALGRERESIPLVEGRYHLELPPGGWCDLHEFEAKVRAAQRLMRQGDDRTAALALLEQATALYGGDLLEDLMSDEWPQSRRAMLQQQYLDALLLLGALYQALHQAPQAIAAYGRALAKDPYAEDAHLELMRLHARSGQRSQALRQYAALTAALAELEAAPSPTAEDLAARIRQNLPL